MVLLIGVIFDGMGTKKNVSFFNKPIKVDYKIYELTGRIGLNCFDLTC